MRIRVGLIGLLYRSIFSFIFGFILSFYLCVSLYNYSSFINPNKFKCDQPNIIDNKQFVTTNLILKPEVQLKTEYLYTKTGERFHARTKKVLFPLEEDISRNQTIVFIEGLPRSGTTLMRVLLDTDPAIYCGPESSFLPNLFSYFGSTLKAMSANELDAAFFREADLDREHVLGGMRGLLLGYLGKRSKDKKVLCEKHVALMEYSEEIVRVLPNIKFIFMIRDIRAKMDHFWQGKWAFVYSILFNYICPEKISKNAQRL